MDMLKKNIFLIDGIGAVITALMLAFVLPRFGIGLPSPILEALAIVAAFFGLYSLGCFLAKATRLVWLTLIIAANTIYCAVTAVVVVLFFGQLNIFGVLYFSGEILVIMILVVFEIKVLKSSKLGESPSA